MAVRMRCKAIASVCVFFVFALAISDVAMAQESGSFDSGDTAWSLASTILSFLMVLPGIALFYGGMVRSRNVLSLLMQCLTLTAILSILWVLVGYSLAFDRTGMVEGTIRWSSFIGGLSDFALLRIDWNRTRGSIPEYLFVMHQMAFGIVASVLMIGSFAERMRFAAVLWFTSLWFLLVYLPVCHMTWSGKGALFHDWGLLDFAGGVVVHVTAGFSALVACIRVGPRAGYPSMLVPPHNLTMTFAGTALLWIGWFGFNAGNAMGANSTAALAILVTHLSACSASVTWIAIEWIRLGRPGIMGAVTGAITGLAAISPAAGLVGPVGALVIGPLASMSCYFFTTSVKKRFRYDDSLDVFGVHGISGVVGSVLVGIFAAKSFGGTLEGLNVVHQVVTQITAVFAVAFYSLIASWVLLKLTQLLVGLRVTGQAEQLGMDLSEHEERGYTN